MGVCTCKKKTDWFCFEHKKAVCGDCYDPQHQLCYINTYEQWLSDLDNWTLNCGVCKQSLTQADDFVRLNCFDLFHTECLDVYGSKFPAHTAKAGFTCPSCKKPIFSHLGDKTQLAERLRSYLQKASWSTNLLQIEDIEPPSTPTSPKFLSTVSTPTQSGNPQLGSVTPLSKEAKKPLNPETSRTDQDQNSEPSEISIQTGVSNFGHVASRKPGPKDAVIYLQEDEDDKYDKTPSSGKGFSRWFSKTDSQSLPSDYGASVTTGSSGKLVKRAPFWTWPKIFCLFLLLILAAWLFSQNVSILSLQTENSQPVLADDPLLTGSDTTTKE